MECILSFRKRWQVSYNIVYTRGTIFTPIHIRKLNHYEHRFSRFSLSYCSACSFLSFPPFFFHFPLFIYIFRFSAPSPYVFLSVCLYTLSLSLSPTHSLTHSLSHNFSSATFFLNIICGMIVCLMRWWCYAEKKKRAQYLKELEYLVWVLTKFTWSL